LVAAISSTLPFAANNTWAGPKFKLTDYPKFAAAPENGGIPAAISV
jgi:hypothetical protein